MAVEDLPTPDYLWRYEATALTYEAYPLRIDVFVEPERYRILRRTPKGVWIEMSGFPFTDKFVLLYGRKRFAYPTKEEALTSFIARKRRQIGICKYQLEVAERAMEIAKDIRELRVLMPDIDSLSPEDQAKIKGCVKGKNDAWKKEHGKDEVPAEVNQRHYSECAKELGLE